TLSTKKIRSIPPLVTAHKVNQQILKVSHKNAKKAIEFENEDLLEEAKSKMKKYYPAMASNFALNWDMAFCKAAGDCKDYLKATAAYAKKEAKGQPDELIDLAEQVQKSFPKDAKAQKLAEDLAEQAVNKGESYKYSYVFANILLKNGKKTEALKVAKNSLSIAEAQGAKADMRQIQKLIDRIEI
ncbi:MAG: hypothetical protein AB8G22_14945, partial [Saprospiraceae bacterium]